MKKVRRRKTKLINHILTYVESRKMVQMDLVSGQEQRHRGREWMCGHGMGRGGWDELGG